MKYGIICAFDREIEFIEKDMQSEHDTVIAGRRYMEGTLYGKEVVLVMSLIGKVASASTATTLIDRFGADCVIFCGCAGGTDKALNVGDVVVADNLVQHDMFDGECFFKIPRLDVADFIPDKALSEAIHRGIDAYLKSDVYEEISPELMEQMHIKSPKVAVGTVASGDQFINDSQKKKWLCDNIKNLKCVEMEGAAVAQVCYEFKVPFAVIRVISDCANEESGIAFDSFVASVLPHFTRGSLKAFFGGIE